MERHSDTITHVFVPWLFKALKHSCIFPWCIQVWLLLGWIFVLVYFLSNLSYGCCPNISFDIELTRYLSCVTAITRIIFLHLFHLNHTKQVLIPPEVAASSLSVGASLSIFSSQVLFDEKVFTRLVFRETLWSMFTVLYKLVITTLVFWCEFGSCNNGSFCLICW